MFGLGLKSRAGDYLQLRGLGARRGAERVDDSAAPRLLMLAALAKSGLEHSLHVTQLLQTRRYRLEPLFDQVLDSMAVGRAKQLRDILQRKARGLGGSNEAQALNVCRCVEPVVGARTASRLQDTLALVVANGRCGNADNARQLSDSQERLGHARDVPDLEPRFKPGDATQRQWMWGPSSPGPGSRTPDQSHSSSSGPIGLALGTTMKSTGNIAVSAAAETGRSTSSRAALTGRKRSFRAGEYPLVTEGRQRQDLRLNRTPEYGFPICTSILGSRPAFETTVLQPAERPMIPNRHIAPGIRIREGLGGGASRVSYARSPWFESSMTVGIKTDTPSL